MRKALASLAFFATFFSAQARAEEPQSCAHVYDTLMVHYKELGKQLPSTFKLYPQLPTHQFLAMGPNPRSDPGAMDVFRKVLTVHSGKIAVMLPLSRWAPTVQGAVMTQIKTYVKSKNLDPEKTIVWYDTGGQIQTLQKQLAQAIYNQHVAAVIGGLSMSEAPVLARWSDKLHVPSIILSRKFDNIKSKYVFHLGPDLPQMAESLAAYAKSKNLSRIAIMMPQNSRDGVFVTDFVGRAEKLGITVTGPLLYNPFDYGSIDTIFRRLFHLNDENRAQEKLDLMNDLKSKAQEEGVAFDPRSLMLPPELDVDAIMIADHFKNARHLAKSLSFYGVKKLPLLGVPKWRAPELIDPPEENLDGATMVDYIGSYKSLPYGIKAETVLDDNFVEGSVASLVDLELVVNHAVAAALDAIKGEKVARYAVHTRLEKVSTEENEFFQAKQVFRGNHEANWPSFLFSLTGGKLQVQNVALSKPKAAVQ